MYMCVYDFSPIQFCHLCQFLYPPQQSRHWTVPPPPQDPWCYPLTAMPTTFLSWLPPWFLQLMAPFDVKAQHYCPTAVVSQMEPDHSRVKRKLCPIPQFPPKNPINEDKSHIQGMTFSVWGPSWISLYQQPLCWAWTSSPKEMAMQKRRLLCVPCWACREWARLWEECGESHST